MAMIFLFWYSSGVLLGRMLLKQVLLLLLSKFIIDTSAIDLFYQISRKKFFLLGEPLEAILESCFRDHLNPLIITEQSSQYIVREPQQASIIVINDEFRIQHDAKNYNPHRGTFVLTASSDDQLNTTMSHLQSTPWWNTESYYVLIGPAAQSCAEASKILAVMWKRKIVSVVYLCFDENKEAVMIYTFNPFNSYAPHLWKQVEVIPDIPGSRWTLYKHQYQKDRIICSAIMFDKTRILDDYVISVIMDRNARSPQVPTGVPIRMSDYIQHIYSQRIAVTMNDVFSYMNVKLNITNSDHLKCCLQTNDQQLLQKLEGLLNDSLLLRPQPMYLGYKHVTYPDARVLMVLLGQKRQFLNTEDKIFSFFHPSISTPIIIVFVMSTIILKINKQQHFLSALLKTWQLFLGSYISQTLTNTPTRIFFIGVFWLVIILNGTFHSKLASFLTKPERIYVKTIEDAFELHYDIYGPVDYMTGTGYLELPPEKRKYLRIVENDRCVNQVLNNSRALCLTNPNHGTTNAKKYNLHLSSPVLIFYTSYWVSPEFPLKKKIDTTILRLQVTGLTGRVLNQVFFDRLGFLQAHENEETKFNRRPVKISDLSFVFRFLVLGLVLSFLVFMAELWSSRNLI